MARKTTFEFPPDEPETVARYWRNHATKLEQQIAELKAGLARKQAFEAGKPVPSIVRAATAWEAMVRRRMPEFTSSGPRNPEDDRETLGWLQRCLATDPEAGVLVSVVSSEDDGDLMRVAPYSLVTNMGPLSLLFVIRDVIL